MSTEEEVYINAEIMRLHRCGPKQVGGIEIIAKFLVNTEDILSHGYVDEIINATWEIDSFEGISKYM